MKICSKCNKEKNIDEYYKNERYKDGLDPVCKVCKKKNVKQRRKQARITANTTQNIPYMRINAANKQIEKETGLILSGYINMNGQLIPIFLKEYNKEKLAKIEEAIPIRRIE